LSRQIVIIDDDSIILKSMELLLESEGYDNTNTFQNGIEALDFIKTSNTAVVLLDLNMPQISGHKVLQILSEEHPEIPVIVITGHNDLDTAIDTMKLGAYDYLVKPVDIERVSIAVKNALEYRALNNSISILKKQFFQEDLGNPEVFSNIVTENSSMLKIFQYLNAISESTQPVLITGETGVGKELFAKAIHKLSNVKGDFVAMDVSSYDSTMFSDALFGHVKGAYTGAEISRDGLLKAAQSGTLFLDEIGDLNLELQSILMRVIQEHEYRQGGSDKILHTDAHLIFATNKDLGKLMEEGKFRKDLFYRLETHYIQIPPLRKRKEDLPVLVNHFVKLASEEINCDKPVIPADLFRYLNRHDFPGNVRELKNLIYNAVVLSKKDTFPIDLIRDKLNQNAIETTGSDGSESVMFGSRLPTFQEAEEILLQEAMKRSDQKQAVAAQILGISRQALNKRINKQK